ncbi:MAG: hypothetical protein EXS35_12375 [Pedosphaera sp.]|nr:hypothetical protein [Pedosphaera sp.]
MFETLRAKMFHAVAEATFEKMVEAGGVESSKNFAVVRDQVISFEFLRAPLFDPRTVTHKNEDFLSRPVPSDRGGGGGCERVGGAVKRDGFVERKILCKGANG